MCSQLFVTFSDGKSSARSCTKWSSWPAEEHVAAALKAHDMIYSKKTAEGCDKR